MFSKKKNYFFQKFCGGPGPPWSSNGSATGPCLGCACNENIRIGFNKCQT